MKPSILAGVATLAMLGAAEVRGQNIVLVGGVGTAPDQLVQPAPPAPVIHQVPGAYAYAPPACAAHPAYSASPYCTPNVVYFGGPHSHYRNYHHGYGSGCVRYSSPVVYFGRGEACRRGYYFTHYR
jgi:hypothetical protein